MAMVTLGRRRIVASLGVVVVILAIAGAKLEYRYGPIDPTDPGWKALVTNDLTQGVVVGDSAENLEIQPGNSEVLVSPGPGQLDAVYTVTDLNHRALGCLAVRLDRQKTVNVSVSSMRPC